MDSEYHFFQGSFHGSIELFLSAVNLMASKIEEETGTRPSWRFFSRDGFLGVESAYGSVGEVLCDVKPIPGGKVCELYCRIEKTKIEEAKPDWDKFKAKMRIIGARLEVPEVPIEDKPKRGRKPVTEALKLAIVKARRQKTQRTVQDFLNETPLKGFDGGRWDHLGENSYLASFCTPNTLLCWEKDLKNKGKID